MKGTDRHRFIGSSGIVTIALLSILPAAPALAQDQPAAPVGSSSPATDPSQATSTADPAASTAEESGGDLEDIIVTAQRRPENIQDVSISIQAITAEGLVKSGITDITRVELVTPGLTFAYGGNDAKIALRGANSNATFQDNSSVVGVFVDGIYKPRASQQTRAFFDVARLEVLKGPQGTLYGRNTLAGAINLYTQAADLRRFAAGLTTSYSRFDYLRSEGYVNLPVSANFAVRLAGLYERSDGYVKNDVGPDIGSKDTVSFRGSAYYEPTDDINATLRVTNIRERGNASGLFATTGTCRTVNAQSLTDALGTIIDCQNPRRGAGGTRAFNSVGKLRVAKDFVNEDVLDEFNATLEVNAGLTDWLGLKAIVSYTDYESVLGQDSDFSEVSHSREWFEENAESYTAELQLGSKGSGPFQYTVGGYASKDEVFFGGGLIRLNRDDQSVRPNVTTPDGFVRPVLIGTPVTNPALFIGAGQTANSFQYVDIDTRGVFGQASYAILPYLRVIGGLRYSSEDKSAINFSGPTSYVGPVNPLSAPTTPEGFSRDPRLATSRTSKVFDNVTYRAAVEFDVNPDVMLYATFATGFLSGSLNTAGQITEEQKSKNYEIGIKSRFWDNRVQFNGSVYRTEYTNLATTFQRPNSAGGVDTLSATGGELTAQGVEAIVDVIPVENLKLTFSASYLDAEYGIFGVLASGQTFGGRASPTARFVNLSGFRPPYTPDFTGTFIGSYDFDMGERGTITPTVQFFYSDSYFAHGNLPFNRAGFQPSYTKTDLRLSWVSADERFGAEIFAENLENEVVNQRTQSGGDGIEQVSWGYPRNYGVRLKAKF